MGMSIIRAARIFLPHPSISIGGPIDLRLDIAIQSRFRQPIIFNDVLNVGKSL
jgi:hypothetical protein